MHGEVTSFFPVLLGTIPKHITGHSFLALLVCPKCKLGKKKIYKRFMFSFKHLFSSIVLQSNFILRLHILFPVNQRKFINLKLNKMCAWEMIEKLMDKTSLSPSNYIWIWPRICFWRHFLPCRWTQVYFWHWLIRRTTFICIMQRCTERKELWQWLGG